MNSLWKQTGQAIRVETLKARCSRLPLVSAVLISMLPLAGGLFMIILRDPELARKAGIISAKAQILTGSADWGAYLNFLAQGTGIGGFALCSFILIWIFGREFSDRTVKDLLALPTSRTVIVLGKFVVFLVWSALLVVWACLLGLLVGAAVSLPPAPASVLMQGLLTFLVTALLTVWVSLPFALAASVWRGFLTAAGLTFLVVILAQVLVILGWGEYFPWAVAALYAFQAAEGNVSLGGVSYGIVILTGLAGVVCTLLWWELADQSR